MFACDERFLTYCSTTHFKRMVLFSTQYYFFSQADALL